MFAFDAKTAIPGAVQRRKFSWHFVCKLPLRQQTFVQHRNQAMATKSKIEAVTVDTIMSGKVQVVDFNAPVSDALRLMAEDNYNAIPVVNANMQCVGILSRADLTETLFAEDKELARLLEAGSMGQLSAGITDTCEDKLVREVMTHEVTTVPLGTPIKEACTIMRNNRIHQLPVVSEGDCVKGIVSTFDLIGWFAEQ